MSAIALDIDGVLTNFAKSFSLLCNNIDDSAPILKDHDDVQDWDWHAWYGYPDLIEAAWDRVFGNWGEGQQFWYKMSPLHDLSYLVQNYRKWPALFITRRDGDTAWFHTVKWLEKHGIEEPLVYRTVSGEEKVDVCKKFGIRILIDDDPKNVIRAVGSGIDTIMPLYPYNTGKVSPNSQLHIAKDLTDALKIAERIRGG